MAEPNGQSDEVHLLEWANVLLSHRYLILVVTIMAGAIAYGLCKSAQPLYEAEAKLMANRDAAQLSRFLSPDLPRSFGEISDRTSMSFVSSYYSELMQSDLLLRPLSRRIRFGGRTLAEVYDIEEDESGSVEDKTTALVRDDLLSIEQDRTIGMLRLRVRTIDPHLSANLANGLIEELQTYLDASRTSGTGRLLRAAEERTSKAQTALQNAQSSLQDFRRRNRTIVTAEQQLRLEQLQMQVEVQKELYIQLHTKVELLRLTEQQETDPVEVIQTAEVPLWKSWPPTKAAVAGAAVFGCLLAVALAFVRSGIRRLMERNAPGCEEFVRHIRALNWILPGLILLLPAPVRRRHGLGQERPRAEATPTDEVSTP